MTLPNVVYAPKTCRSGKVFDFMLDTLVVAVVGPDALQGVEE